MIREVIYSIFKKIMTISYRYRCSVCHSKIKKYIPLPLSFKENSEKHGYKYFGQNEHLNVNSYSCPNCKSSDRDRLYAAYFSNYLKVEFDSKKEMLHVAPSWGLNNIYLKKYYKLTTVDLLMPDVDYNLNIEDLKIFNDNTFDFIICSHVIEHVNYPQLALKELFRILKSKGEAILMVPINPYIKETIENPEHITKEDRLKHYGQEDHLRLYSKNGFMNEINNAGFQLKMIDKSDLGVNQFRRLGLKSSSVLYIGVKP